MFNSKILLLLIVLISCYEVVKSDCSTCSCVKVSTLCCNDVCTSTTTQYACPTSPPTPAPCTVVQDYINSLPTSYDFYEVNSPTQEFSYVYSTIVSGSFALDNILTYCVDYDDAIFSYTPYNVTHAYPYTEVIANPALASHINEPDRLNQIAWIINNINVGDVATNLGSYTGAGAITSTDIQSAIWALVEAPGKCDNFASLCADTITDVNVANVYYIYSQALVAVPDGTSYDISESPLTYPIIPFIVVPGGIYSQAVQVMIILIPSPYSCNSVAPTIAPTSAPTCVCNIFNYDISIPQFEYYIDSPVQDVTYVYSTISSDGITYLENLPAWCIDYHNEIAVGVYNESVSYVYTEVNSNPTLLPQLARPLRVNQIAWLVNHIFVGDVVTTPQTYQGVTYTDNGVITASDIQAAIWALIEPTGSCDIIGQLCLDSLSSVSNANFAYIVNSALSAVPDGTTYIVSSYNSLATVPLLPVIIIPKTASNSIYQVMLATVPAPCSC
eukprot:gene18263-23938_t